MQSIFFYGYIKILDARRGLLISAIAIYICSLILITPSYVGVPIFMGVDRYVGPHIP